MNAWLDIRFPQGLLDEFRRAAADFYYQGFEHGFIAGVVVMLVIVGICILVRPTSNT